MICFVPVRSIFPYSLPPDLTGRYLLTHDSIAALLSATRRAREGEFVGGLRTRPAISLKEWRKKAQLIRFVWGLDGISRLNGEAGGLNAKVEG